MTAFKVTGFETPIYYPGAIIINSIGVKARDRDGAIREAEMCLSIWQYEPDVPQIDNFDTETWWVEETELDWETRCCFIQDQIDP